MEVFEALISPEPDENGAELSLDELILQTNERVKMAMEELRADFSNDAAGYVDRKRKLDDAVNRFVEMVHQARKPPSKEVLH